MRITKNTPWFLVFESQKPFQETEGAFGFMKDLNCELGNFISCRAHNAFALLSQLGLKVSLLLQNKFSFELCLWRYRNALSG